MKTKILILFLFILSAINVFAQRRPPKAPPRAVTMIRGDAINMGKPGEWREVVSEEGAFKVAFPGEPVSPKKSLEARLMMPNIITGSYYLQAPKVYYNFFFNEHTDEGKDAGKLKSIYDAKRDLYLSGADFKLVSERDVFLGQHLGRERVTSDGAAETFTKTRTFVINRMIYELSATASKTNFAAEQGNIDKFLDSFALTGAPPKRSTPPDYEAAWRELVSKEAEFKIVFPGVPARRLVPRDKKPGEKMLFYTVFHAGGEFDVAVSDYPYVVEDLDALNSAYDQFLGYFQEKPGQKIESSREVTAGKHIGREVSVKDTEKEAWIRARVFVIGKRLYQLIAISPSEQSSEFYEKNARRFFDSFQFTGAQPSITEIAARPLPQNIRGEIGIDAVYRNEYFDFSMAFPEDWQELNPDEMALAAEAGKTVFGGADAKQNARIDASLRRTISLVAISKLTFGLPQNAMLWVSADKTTNPTQTLRQIAELNQKTLQERMKTGANVTRPAYETKIGGENFSALEVEIEAYGSKVKQKLFLAKRKDYVLRVLQFYFVNDDAAEMSNIVKSLKFGGRK